MSTNMFHKFPLLIQPFFMSGYRSFIAIGGIVVVLCLGIGSATLWPQTNTSVWQLEAARWVKFEKRMWLQQAACKTKEFQLNRPNELDNFDTQRDENFSMADQSFVHALHMHGLTKKSYDMLDKEISKQSSSDTNIFKEMPPSLKRTWMEIQLDCAKLGVKANPAMGKKLNSLVVQLGEDLQNFENEQEIRPLTTKNYSHLFVNWWELKRDLLVKLRLSSLPVLDYQQKRYDRIKKYRHSVEKLFRQKFTNETSYSEFSSGIDDINSLIHQSGVWQKKWKEIQIDLKPWVPKIRFHIHQEMGMVFGIILDKDTQAPVSDVPLVLRSVLEKNRKVVSQIRSDERGRFVFPHLAPGKYNLSSELKFGPGEERAYRSERESFFIRMDEVLMIDFFLKNEKVILKPARPAKK